VKTQDSDTNTDKTKAKSKIWQRTKHTNIVRYKPNGGYHTRMRVKGKLIWHSLKTNSITVAQLRHADFAKEIGQTAESREAMANGEMTFGQALDIYIQRLDSDPKLKPKSKLYRHERINALVKSWKGLKKKDVRRISKQDCLDWAGRYHKQFSQTNYNNTVGTLQGVMEIAKEAGAIYQNYAKSIERVPVVSTPRDIPQTLEVFHQLFEHIKHDSAADLIRFLAYGGFRISEASKITWSDVNMERGTILAKGDEETTIKNSRVRARPMIPDMKELLERLASERPNRKPTDRIMTMKTCQGSIDTACAAIGIPRFTHHALRDYFITRCLEERIPPHVIADWVNHKDKGVTILKKYAHVLDAHSIDMAKDVSFKPKAKAA
jgi:integrase